ncbi:MAG TPA: MFS transporter [Candidatus Saccharimonadales bacterium]|nr:MFS transporter [Candidatus Saccharimonadales bacterium]
MPDTILRPALEVAPLDSEMPPVAAPAGEVERKGRLWMLSGLHFANDAYSNFLGQLMPLLVQRFHLTLAAAGGLASTNAVVASLSQPLFGTVADRLRRPWFSVLGPLVTGLFFSCLLLAPGAGWLVALLVLGGLGSSVFHPQSAGWAARWSGRHRARDMAFFITGGSIGFSLGPVYVAGALRVLGVQHIYWMALPGALLTFSLMPALLRERAEVRRAPAERGRLLAGVLGPMVILFFVVVIRSGVNQAVTNFLPLLIAHRSRDPMAGAVPTTLFLLAGALGGFAGGPLADRFGRRNVILWSMVPTAPLLAGFLQLHGPASWVCLLLTGLTLQLSLPVNVVYAQELVPHQMSTVSGLMMGFAWGVSALMLAPIGWAGDHFGLPVALTLVCALPLVGIVLAAVLPNDRKRARAA